MPDHKLQLIPLGGLGEFGMNSRAIRYGDDIIVIDAGMMFPDAELLGVDIVTPDFAYLEQNKDKVRALFLTHGHEDHIGGIPFLLRKLNKVKPGDKVTLGAFSVEFVHVTHSIVSCVAMVVTTPIGIVIHTGDF